MKRRRIIALLLSLTLLFSLISSVSALTNVSNWAKSELAQAEAANLIPDSLINSNAVMSLTRQEMCDLTVHALETILDLSFYPRSTTHFTDTTSKSVNILYELGIVNGYGNGTFAPQKNITRQEYAKILAGLVNLLGWDVYEVELGQFTDGDAVSGWAREYASTMIGLGLVGGNADGTLAPRSYTTREQMLCVILRSYELLAKEQGIVPMAAAPQPTDSEALLTDDIAQTASAEDGELAEEAAVFEDGELAEATAAPEDAEPAAAEETAVPEADTSEEDAARESLADPAATEIAEDMFVSTELPAQSMSVKRGYVCSTWAEKQLARLDGYGLIPEILLQADLRQIASRKEITYAAVLLCEKVLQKKLSPSSATQFTDTNDRIIQTAYELGIITGISNTTFKPNDPLTREQMFKIVASTLKVCGLKTKVHPTKLSFADASSISGWAKKSVLLLHQMHVLQGDTKNRMLPTANITREQAIAMVFRTYTQVNDWYAAHPLDDIPGPGITGKTAQQLVDFALSLVGSRYVYGGASPATGFDCSGFTSYVFAQFGYKLNRTAADQSKNGVAVDRSALMPGDLLIFSVAGDRSKIGHVGIYIGNGQMVHAANPASGVCVTYLSYYDARYLGARRIII